MPVSIAGHVDPQTTHSKLKDQTDVLVGGEITSDFPLLFWVRSRIFVGDIQLNGPTQRDFLLSLSGCRWWLLETQDAERVPRSHHRLPTAPGNPRERQKERVITPGIMHFHHEAQPGIQVFFEKTRLHQVLR